MKKRSSVVYVLFFAAILLVSHSAKAAEWRFPVGFSYVSGIGDVVDLYKDNLEAEGYDVDTSWEFPVGISFHPYVEFDSGLGFGGGIRPVMWIYSTEADFFDLPVGLDLRYTLIPRAKASPYVRAGARYHIASGDYVEKSSAGFFGAVGVEIMRNKIAGIGIELSFDSSEIELERKHRSSYSSHGDSTYEDFKPCKFMVSIFAVF